MASNKVLPCICFHHNKIPLRHYERGKYIQGVLTKVIPSPPHCHRTAHIVVRNRFQLDDDEVVLHVGWQDSPASPATPSKSPFLVKIETFLRMNDIAYAKVSAGEGGASFAKVMNGRNNNAAAAATATSWVTFKGAVITDPEVAIDVLSRAFRVAEKLRFTAEQARQWSRSGHYSHPLCQGMSPVRWCSTSCFSPWDKEYSLMMTECLD